MPILCLVTDLQAAGGSIFKVADTVSDAVAGGVNMVQVRIHDADESRFSTFFKAVKSSAKDHAIVIANVGPRSVPDSSLPFDGLHFPEAENHNIQLARQRPATSNTMLGCSAHSPEAVAESTKLGADYIILGTIFKSESHPSGKTQGLSLIRDSVNSTHLPIIAIGGINSSNAASAIAAGASGVAVIRAIANDPNPKQAATDLMRQIQSAWNQRN